MRQARSSHGLRNVGHDYATDRRRASTRGCSAEPATPGEARRARSTTRSRPSCACLRRRRAIEAQIGRRSRSERARRIEISWNISLYLTHCRTSLANLPQDVGGNAVGHVLRVHRQHRQMTPIRSLAPCATPSVAWIAAHVIDDADGHQLLLAARRAAETSIAAPPPVTTAAGLGSATNADCAPRIIGHRVICMSRLTGSCSRVIAGSLIELAHRS